MGNLHITPDRSPQTKLAPEFALVLTSVCVRTRAVRVSFLTMTTLLTKFMIGMWAAHRSLPMMRQTCSHHLRSDPPRSGRCDRVVSQRPRQTTRTAENGNYCRCTRRGMHGNFAEKREQMR